MAPRKIMGSRRARVVPAGPSGFVPVASPSAAAFPAPALSGGRLSVVESLVDSDPGVPPAIEPGTAGPLAAVPLPVVWLSTVAVSCSFSSPPGPEAPDGCTAGRGLVSEAPPDEG